MGELLAFLPVLLGLLLAKGFFSGSEIALVSSDKLKLRSRAERGDRGAKRVLKLFLQPEVTLATTLIGTNICTMSLTVLCTALMIEFAGTGGELYAVLILTPTMLILGEIVPKSIYQQYADVIAPRVAGLLSVVRLSGMTVGEAMVPLARVSGAPLHSSMKKLLAISRSTGHRRIPLFEGNSSNTTEVAVWAIWDELDPGFATSRLRDHSLKPYFASPVQRLDELMPVLLARKDRMAIVVDEFGSAAGIVTVEDLMMILLGDVARGVHLGPGGWGSSPELSRLADNIVVMDAQARLLDAAELLDLDLPSRDYHTLAGFLTSNFGRIPIEGVVVEAYGYPFTVVEGSTRAPHRIRIEPA